MRSGGRAAINHGRRGVRYKLIASPKPTHRLAPVLGQRIFRTEFFRPSLRALVPNDWQSDYCIRPLR